MCFSIGQKVVYLSEEGGGIIKDISGNKFLVEDESGFDYWRYSHELAMVHKEEYGENVAVKDRSGIQTKAKVREENGWREIDLHIEELIDSHKHMSNTEIVNHQIAALRHFVEKARLDGIRRLLVIHGVGTGVLKQEVHSFFRKIDVLEINYADHRKYGWGATEIILKQNPKY